MTRSHAGWVVCYACPARGSVPAMDRFLVRNKDCTWATTAFSPESAYWFDDRDTAKAHCELFKDCGNKNYEPGEVRELFMESQLVMSPARTKSLREVLCQFMMGSLPARRYA